MSRARGRAAAPARGARGGPRRPGAPRGRSRTRQSASGRSIRRASATVSTRAGSNPRARRRAGAAGTGTSTAAGSRSDSGQVRGHVRRHQVRRRQRAAELQRRDEPPRHALVGQRRPRARERRVRRRDSARPRCVGSPQRGHPPCSHGSARVHSAHSRSADRASARPHARHPGGATTAISSPEQVHRRIVADGPATDQHAIVTILRSVRTKSAREPRCRSMRGGHLRPSCCSHSSPTPGSTSGAGGSRAPRAARGPRPSASSSLWLTGIFCLFVALISPVDRLGEQLASDAHGPAPADRRPRADLPDARADQAHPAPGHAPDPAARARGRAVRASGVRRRRLRRRDVDLAHPDVLRGRARTTRSSTCSST